MSPTVDGVPCPARAGRGRFAWTRSGCRSTAATGFDPAGRILLVGDTAGYIDALTGEGLGFAFGAAELAVKCVGADRPGDYDRRWRRMTRRYRVLIAALPRASGCAPLRSRIVPAAQALPPVFGSLMNLLAQ